MIKNETVPVIICKRNKKRYDDLGYKCNIGDTINVQILHLSKGCKIDIDVICDKCNKEKIIKFNSLFKNNYLEKYICEKCKREENLMKKYGVKNVFQLNDIKEKSKETIKKLYGVEYITQNENIKLKIKNTNKKLYGVEYFLSNELVKEQIKNTVMNKYGVKNISMLNDIKLKKENTCLKNHGVKIISKHKKFKNLIKENNITKLTIKYNINFLDIKEDSFIFKCDKCDKEYEIGKKAFYTRFELNTIMCTICNPINSFTNSGFEIQLQDFIKENYNKEIQLNKRNIISPYELDIYLPDLKLAFEFNGLFWHNELGIDNNYHYNKTELCEQHGIHLIHIFEDDWKYKQKIVKSRILNLLGKTPNKIYGRKCIIKEITDNKLIRDFLENNHLQGFVGSQIKLGLLYNDELISLMIFGSKRISMGSKSKDDNIYEMLRFCSKLNTSVIGGSEKLFKYFIEKYKPVEVISYADRSWSQGKLYQKLGFKLIHKTQPNYYYIVNGIRKYRFNYRKDKLIRDGFDSNKTEHEIMLERKIYRIYDSGSLKFNYS